VERGEGNRESLGGSVGRKRRAKKSTRKTYHLGRGSRKKRGGGGERTDAELEDFIKE